LGGMLANNSGGMSCGTCENAYATIDSIQLVLPNGLYIDTADPAAAEILHTQAPGIDAGLRRLHRQVMDNPALVERIQKKYTLKNTTGFSLNALVDYSQPVDILAHLVIGSEGALAFIAGATLHPFPVCPLASTGLLLFRDVRSACAAIPRLNDCGAFAIEMMDRAAMRSVEAMPGVRQILGELPEQAFGLLVEFAAADPPQMDALMAGAGRVLAELDLLRPAGLTSDPAQRALMWKIRKGLFTSASAMRPAGTTALIEDLAFHIPDLGQAIPDLQELLRRHGYAEPVLWGHAKDGNVHFVIAQSFASAEECARYDRLMRDLVDLTVRRYDGSLKAEHGTGRNMAPFVEVEWGPEAYAIMREIKALFDPDNLLNPGVIINDDPSAHLRSPKPLPAVDKAVDTCIECGFCELNCPSRDLSLTPRQRIVVRRELARLQREDPSAPLAASLAQAVPYAVRDTCAADGLCATACPVNIDVGKMVKELRSETASPTAQRVAGTLANAFGALEGGLKLGTQLGHVAAGIIGVDGVSGLTQAAEKVVGARLPRWNAAISRPNWHRQLAVEGELAEAVYFPSCFSRTLGTNPGHPGLIQTVIRVARRAGMGLFVPPDSQGHCCGMPFASKGYPQAYQEILSKTLAQFWSWSDHGRLPIVIDSSSCAYTLRSCQEHLSGENLEIWNHLTLLDPIEFAHDRLLPRLSLQRQPGCVALHPNCASRKLGLEGKLMGIARACSEDAFAPLNLGCCGFAGDRGLLYPELTQSATQAEAAEIKAGQFSGYYSSNLTCEWGMRLATGKPYQSIYYLIERASR